MWVCGCAGEGFKRGGGRVRAESGQEPLYTIVRYTAL